VELARGSITDRPWGMTLFALARREHSGEILVLSEVGTFRIAMRRGGIVGATCPRLGDVATRVASAGGFLSAAWASEATRRIAQAPNRDPIDVIVDIERLTPDRALRLRRRVIAQAAARTFALERGDFTVNNETSLDGMSGLPIDVRAVVYLASRAILDPGRIAIELAPYGTRFALSAEADDSLARFGFGDAERPVLEALAGGAGLAELSAALPALDPRIVHGVVYAVVTCLACAATTAPEGAHRIGRGTPMLAYTADASGSDSGLIHIPEPTMPPPMSTPRTTTPPPSRLTPAPTLPTRPRTTSPSMPVPSRTGTASMPVPSRTATPSSPVLSRTGTPSMPVPSRTATPSIPAQPRTAPTTAAPRAASPSSPAPSRTTTRAASSSGSIPTRTTAPMRSASPSAPLPSRTTTPPSGPTRSGAGPTTPVPPGTVPGVGGAAPRPDTTPPPVGDGHAAVFARGRQALDRDDLAVAVRELRKAVELAPEVYEYQAMLAWAQFRNADDREAIAHEVRQTLMRAIVKSTNPDAARFYLGRVERMLGRDREALRHFQIVLEEQPRNAEAAAEIRYLENRLNSRR
jgi:hypothetical protein